jgi:hypothetical protein
MPVLRRISDTMTMNPMAQAFDTAMRGYERTAVDSKVAALAAERAAFDRRAVELEREIQRMRGAMSRGESAPYYVTLSRKLEGILREADEDGNRACDEAAAMAQRDRDAAQAECEAAYARMDAEAQRAEATAREAMERMMDEARREAEMIRIQGTEKAAQTANGAAEVVESARARGAQLATEVETKMTAQREQFERDVVTRQETAERRLQETAQMSAQLKTESITITEDSQRAAQALIEAARAAAVELVTETASRAERLQQEAEREVAALTHRRDSINAQLTGVRETLASLSGAANMAAMGHANGN